MWLRAQVYVGVANVDLDVDTVGVRRVVAGASESLGYDCNGSLLARVATSGGVSVSSSYVWDELHRLTGVTRSGVGSSRFVYDAAGQRVLRVDPDGSKTIYLGSTELRWSPATPSTVKVARFYPGGTQRGFDGTLTYTVSGYQGSVLGSVNATTGVVTHNRFTPYGVLRAGTAVNDKAFLGETTDPATNLVYLNARYHDPSLGTFISVDPLVTATGEPYTYGSGSPTTLSDPSGLIGMGNTCVAGAAKRGGCDPIRDNRDPRTSVVPPIEVSDEDLVDSVEFCMTSYDSCRLAWYGDSSYVNPQQLRSLMWASEFLQRLVVARFLDRDTSGQFNWYGFDSDGLRVPYLTRQFVATGTGPGRQVQMLMSDKVDLVSWDDVATVAGVISTGAGIVAVGCAGATLFTGGTASTGPVTIPTVPSRTPSANDVKTGVLSS
jgi:RHS repeat-associated protein